MAETIIPPPDANGWWHFTYRTTDIETGQWYGGKRSTKKHPLADRYRGSGNWIKAHPARDRLRREVVAFYATSKDVYAAEAELVTWAVVWGDPLCMNLRDGGEGTTVETSRVLFSNPLHRAKIAAANRRKATEPEWKEANAAGQRRKTADPKWQAAHADRLRRLIADPKWQEANAAKNRLMYADPAWREKTAANNRSRANDPEWCAAIRSRWADPEYREKVAAAQRSAWENPERKEKAVVHMLSKANDPEFRVKMKAMAERRWTLHRAAQADAAVISSQGDNECKTRQRR